jgi:hypothetical protein
MGGFFGKIGKSISKAFKKAAPILIPLALTAATGGAGGGIFGGLGKIGSKLASGVLGNLVSSKTSNKPIGPDDVAVEPEGNFLQGLFKAAAPALITRAIEGKPKSAKDEAARHLAAAPGTTPAAQKAAADLSGMLSSNLANPTKLALGAPGQRTPMVYGSELAASSAPQTTNDVLSQQIAPTAPGRISYTNPLAPVAPTGIMTGGTIGSPAAPINFNPVTPADEFPGARRSRAFAIRGRAA